MFITIDGPDGSGKTTAAKTLCQLLGQAGIPAAFTSEPTSSPLGKSIRKLLREGGADAARMTDLFVQDRSEHVRDFILPRQEEGIAVVCDRYRYSTVAYQHVHGEPLERLLELNNPFPTPDLAFILVPQEGVEVLLKRMDNRGGKQDIYEKKDFQEQVTAIYRNMKEYYPEDPVFFLDAGLDMDEAPRIMLGHVLQWKNRNGGWK